jgi:RNA-directed DNA polymerase
MPRRSPLDLGTIADLSTLGVAFWQAARGKRSRPDVLAFSARLDENLACLRDAILDGRAPEGRWTSFEIRDPKRRQILAPCFADRVLHHAMMLPMAPILDRALVSDTFACRPGKGSLAAVLRAQQHLRRFPWFVKVDVRAYFASIDHGLLREVLHRRFKNPGLLALCDRVLARTPGDPGRGLPIGALTSQHFANSYLDALDRHLLEALRVRGLVRYMDDVVWWCDEREQARVTLDAARAFVAEERRLALKDDARIGRSAAGLPFLGFRILPGEKRLSLRRKRRYALARARWERAFLKGEIDAGELQAGYGAALSITAHANAIGFRRAELGRRPPLDA